MRLVVLGLLLLSVAADIYGHNPRFSNNRLNEQSADRTNGNRLFDSQNNNRGGYNVGEKSKNAFSQNTPVISPAQTFDPNTIQDVQYQMVYYEGSKLVVEWTNQHGCGGREHAETVNGVTYPQDTHALNCNIHLQYMCDTIDTLPDPSQRVILRDGANTNTPDAATTVGDIANQEQNNINNKRGHHESESWYFECATRSRNKGLFLADQNVKGNDARYTRQNPNGDRRGLECPEERDYYPYWVPSPWRDVAYLTDDQSYCTTVLAGTQNTNLKGKCTSLTAAGAYNTGDQDLSKKIAALTPADCAKVQGTWVTTKHDIPAPYCGQVTGWSRENHLGNGREGQPLTYNWTVPTLAELGPNVKLYDTSYAKCVLRLRYNMTTDDYAPYATNASMNEDKGNGVVSPVSENPTVDVGADMQGLKLAINTAQFGRTFQDRTHVFYIKGRSPNFIGKTIQNLNVRGKRGNIVQTYPSVEYDFVPNSVTVKAGTLLHVQWTGSNTHNNGNPAGDGQAGDAGEGTGGTDRNNFVQMFHPSDNYPLPLDKFTDNIFTNNKCYNLDGNEITSKTDCALILATSGQYRTVATVDDSANAFSPTLDVAPASLVGGIVLEMTQTGHYHYMCTRNNNFSNRSQKGSLSVIP